MSVREGEGVLTLPDDSTISTRRLWAVRLVTVAILLSAVLGQPAAAGAARLVGNVVGFAAFYVAGLRILADTQKGGNE